MAFIVIIYNLRADTVHCNKTACNTNAHNASNDDCNRKILCKIKGNEADGHYNKSEPPDFYDFNLFGNYRENDYSDKGKGKNRPKHNRGHAAVKLKCVFYIERNRLRYERKCR